MTKYARRDLLRMAGCAATASALPMGCGSGGDSRPNIIIMMADDMGFSDLGCYGSEINTPHIDRLAANGLRFTQFYNTARCCPTRASLLTGLYQHQAGVGHMMEDYGRPGYRGDLNRECVTIAEALRPAGYTNYMSGKWHVTPAWAETKHNWPLQRGFDEFFGTIHGAGSFYDPSTLTRGNESIEPEDADFYYTTAIGDNAARFIDGHAGKPNPFFLYVPFTSPHWPLHAFEEDIAKYHGRYDSGWDALRQERRAKMIEMGLIDERWPLTARDERVPAWEDVDHKKWHARRMEVYSAQIEVMDRAVGTIMTKLEEHGMTDSTLVLFLADNGGCAEEIQASWETSLHIPDFTRDGRRIQRGNDPAVMPGPELTYQSYGVPWANASNTPFRLYKHWVHEGGIATPLIAHWPSRIKDVNTLSTEPGHLIDIMATCLDAAKTRYPEIYEEHKITPLEGKSLMPVLEQGTREGHEAIYWEHEGNRAVRHRNWKLVSRYANVADTDGPWELYDLEADRTEMNNLAKTNPEKLSELIAMYKAWAARAQVEPWRSWVES